MSDKGLYGRCDICGSDIPGIENFLMGCPSKYHTLSSPEYVNRLKERDEAAEQVLREIANAPDDVNAHWLRKLARVFLVNLG